MKMIVQKVYCTQLQSIGDIHCETVECQLLHSGEGKYFNTLVPE